jgi:Tfp pilus assembly protein PilX
MKANFYQNNPLVVTLVVLSALSTVLIVGDRLYTYTARKDCFTKARAALGVSEDNKLNLNDNATAAVAYSTYNNMCLANEYGI